MGERGRAFHPGKRHAEQPAHAEGRGGRVRADRDLTPDFPAKTSSARACDRSATGSPRSTALGLLAASVAVDVLENVDRGRRELRAEPSRQPRQDARAPARMLRRDLRADRVEILPLELGMGVFERGELAKMALVCGSASASARAR